MEYLGVDKERGRRVYLVSALGLEQLPPQIQLPCARFVLLLIEGGTARGQSMSATMGRLLDIGCVYLCAWGPGCEYVHDTMDDEILERDLKERKEGVIMTTWHTHDTLAEVLDFALPWALPDDYYAEGCDAIVVANIADATDPKELHRLLCERVAPQGISHRSEVCGI